MQVKWLLKMTQQKEVVEMDIVELGWKELM